MTVRAAALVLALFMLPVFSASRARAATYEDINQPEVFLRQETKITCTLASATMLIRRAAMMNGNADWASITESAVKKVAWSNGLRYTFTYAGIKINHESSSFTRARTSRMKQSGSSSATSSRQPEAPASSHLWSTPLGPLMKYP